MRTAISYLVPAALGAAVLCVWQLAVGYYGVPAYVLPGPTSIGLALADNFSSLMQSLWTTLRVTLEAFALAVAGGVALAILFSQSRAIETALYPYAVILQVTPIV